MKSLLRPTLSSFLVFAFALVLIFLGLFAEVFESQEPELDLAQIYANPIPISELQHIKSLKIINKQGEFFLENTDPKGFLTGPWQLLEPQSLKVKDDVVTRIIEALNVVRVRNFHHYEPINITSFSLDNPTLILKFTTTREKVFEIKMGLINPIDNSAYLTLSSQGQIYQIDPIEMALESYDLAQLVESKVLALGRETLGSVEIATLTGLQLKLLKKDNEWVDQTGLTLNTSKVQNFFEKVENIESFSLLTTLSPEQKTILEKIISTPDFSLKLISAQGFRNYFLSEIKNIIPGIPSHNKPLFVMSSEDKKTFVIIEKEQLKVLNTKSNELK